MRFHVEPSPYVKWRRIFALWPHYCDDVHCVVWLEYVWRTLECSYGGAWYEYRLERPRD